MRHSSFVSSILIFALPVAITATSSLGLALDESAPDESKIELESVKIYGRLYSFNEKFALIVCPEGQKIRVPVALISKDQRRTGRMITVEIHDHDQLVEFDTRMQSRKPASEEKL